MKYLILVLAFLTASGSFAQKYLSKEMAEIEVNRKDAVFSSKKTLLENTSQSSELTIFSQIIEQPAIQDLLNKQEMVTVFVILDDAFSDLNKKKKQALLSDREKLKKMVAHLSIPGRVDQNGMEVAVKKNNGKAWFSTLQGTELTIVSENDKLYIVDPNGKKAAVSATNFFHKNGIFHFIDKRLFLD